MIFQYINNLCDDLKDHIYTFIKDDVKAILNKQYYIKKYDHIYNKIPKVYYNNYIRGIIRKDYDLILKLNLNINFNKWKKKRKYKYKKYKTDNYINYLLVICDENNSNKCKDVIWNYIKKSGLEQLWFKRIVVNDNKWTN